MSYFSLTYHDDGKTVPNVYSMPPYRSHGRIRPACITVEPWAEREDPDPFDDNDAYCPRTTDISIDFTVEEAEALARKLVEVVKAAKRGEWSERGLELAKAMEED